MELSHNEHFEMFLIWKWCLCSLFLFKIPFIFGIPVMVLDLLGSSTVAVILHFIFSFLYPPYTLFGGLYYISKVSCRQQTGKPSAGLRGHGLCCPLSRPWCPFNSLPKTIVIVINEKKIIVWPCILTLAESFSNAKLQHNAHTNRNTRVTEAVK